MISVSAIITTHNRLNELKTAISSVRNQTYRIEECIVVDDASEDGTFDWMSENCDNWLKYIRIEKRDSKGGNYARNLGLKASTSDYVAFLDDDDSWVSTKIEKQIQVVKEHPECGCVYCGSIYYDGIAERVNIPDTYYSGNISHKVFTEIIATTSMLLINRKVLDEIGGFDENLRFWQETEMMMRLCQCAEVYCACEPLIYYCDIPSPERLSTKYYSWLESIDYIKEKHAETIKQLTPDEARAFQILVHRDAAYRCNSKKLRKERKKHLKEMFRLNKSAKNLVLLVFNFSNDEKKTIKRLFCLGNRID